MIRFSRSEDYAIILVNKLAAEYNRRLVTLTEVAKEYDISLFFLRNLATILRNAGLIKATEGKFGGYTLTKNPKKIKMGDILRNFSSDEELTCCSNDKDHARVCPKQKNCVAGNTWRKLNKEFIDKVYNLSLNEFVSYNK
ncbi:MAG TPA: Rrf2 family transcriptional regulator [Candidatus Saccharimonadales bacterium]|nr:Rrf2 family transcriptional regulator [Candidatus Saccharimonadales bacterium]